MLRAGRLAGHWSSWSSKIIDRYRSTSEIIDQYWSTSEIAMILTSTSWVTEGGLGLGEELPVDETLVCVINKC